MRFTSLCLSISSMLGLAAAGPGNHAVQNIYYYYSYLADEIMNPHGYTVAPGCGPAFHVDRCSFNQFLQYIWAPNRRIGEVGPIGAVGILNKAENFKDIPLQRLQARVQDWREPAPGVPLQGSGYHRRTVVDVTDSQKLYPGATDFFDGLKKVGIPLGQLRDQLHAHPNAAHTWIVTGADAASAWLVDWRKADLERYRIRAVRATLQAKGITLATTPGRVTQAPREQPWQKIDIIGTLNINSNMDVRTVRTEVLKALNTWRRQAGHPADHYKALWSAMTSRVRSGCETD